MNEELREAISDGLYRADLLGARTAGQIADAVLALPEVAALRADADESGKRLEALIRVRRERDALRAEVAALCAKADAADRVRVEVESWADASREWYYAHRHDAGGTTYACGFEDGWDHAEERARRALDGDQP